MNYYVINSNQVSSETFENEAVVVNFMTGKYFGMSGSGPDIWRVFERPCSVEHLLTMLNNAFGGLSEGQINNVKSFIDDLAREHLLVTAGVPEKTSTVYSFDGDGKFFAPVLDIYDDLRELIVLDPIHDADPERGWPVQQRMIKP